MLGGELNLMEFKIMDLKVVKLFVEMESVNLEKPHQVALVIAPVEAAVVVEVVGAEAAVVVELFVEMELPNLEKLVMTEILFLEMVVQVLVKLK
jgi:hypothetical protein